MYLAAFSAAALGASCVYGYENSSPLFIYSTSSIEFSNTQNVASAASIQSSVSESIAQCPTKNYVLISQPGVSTDDFSDPRNTPLLRRRLSTTNAGQSSFVVRDVIDSIDTGSIVESMSNSCVLGARDIDASAGFIPDIDRSKRLENVFNVAFPALNNDLSEAERHVMLLAHDSYVESLIDNYFNNEDYTMIYTTSSVHAAKNSLTSSERQIYEMQDAPLREIMHSGELRRSLSKRKDGSSSNQTIVDGPLFDKYQFLSPGIFMGGLVSLILLAILYVGVSALSSLQVTYGAFDKDQGQLAAKKQQ